ncbi:hypothetical protein [Deinococcus sedimenti]|uniref:Integrase n=1 Tax=Deinococcus sedimenti TaxID=1867090 RepID=A0ABQ2S5T6_9DEIO|nr:hypothetical protein [Deinococcus sedimenti]GGR92233.1 hypothetical protein GCM10008960_18840 [Deinococcus sedimenti]
MTHPEDQLARTLTRALTHADPDTLITTLHQHDLIRGTPAQLISNLKPILAAADRDHVSILHPPADFHAWLHAVLATKADGTPSRANTRISRVTTLRSLYRALRALHLITGDPLLDFQNPSAERRDTPLPTRDDLDRLVRASQKDPALHAALLLLWHHALPITGLLRLTWAAYTPEDGTLLRGDLITTLTPQADAALTRLHQRAGHDPLYPETHGTTSHLRLFPYDTQDALRLSILRTTRDADLAFIPPGQVRRAALRDHPSAAHQLGYTRDKEYQRALRHAQAVADTAQTD